MGWVLTILFCRINFCYFKAVTCHHCKIHQVPVLGLVSCHRKGLLAARLPKLPSLPSRSHTSLPSRSHTSLPSHLKAALNPNHGDWLEEPCRFWVMERGNQLIIIRLFCWNSSSTMTQHPEKSVRKLILDKFYFGVVGFNHMIVWYQYTCLDLYLTDTYISVWLHTNTTRCQIKWRMTRQMLSKIY